MNPNNDAYWADQENRFGGDEAPEVDDGGAGAEAAGPAKGRAHNPLDALVDPDLGHPGRYSSIDLASLRWDFEAALATPASEERDRMAATAEFLRLAAKILEVARDAAIRQGVGGQLRVSVELVELFLDDGRSIHAASIDDQRIVTVSGSKAEFFEHSGRKWHHLVAKTNDWNDHKKLVRSHDYRALQPLPCLISWVTSGCFTPALAELRQQVARHIDSKRLRDVCDVQARIARVLSRLPEPLRISGWEDDWAPGRPLGPAAAGR